MKPRTALHIIVGLLVATALVFLASNLVAGSGSSLADMVNAQRRTPVLWVVDACAIALVGVMWWSAIVLNQFHSFVENQATQHHEQLDDMIERTSDLERANDEYADRVERLEAELARQFRDLTDQVMTLEAASDARQKVFEIETRRISEHTFRIFQAQIEANTRHVEAMNLALQFQRGELRRLRYEFRELQNELVPRLGLKPKPYDILEADDDGKAIESGARGAEGASSDFNNGLNKMLSASESAASPDSGESSASYRAGRLALPEMAAPDSPETPANEVSGAASHESGGNGKWTTDQVLSKERNSEWRSHVDRLFHEARAAETLPDATLAPKLAVAAPPLRIVASSEGDSSGGKTFPGEDADKSDAGDSERPAASEASA